MFGAIGFFLFGVMIGIILMGLRDYFWFKENSTDIN